jgi:hypothetical protein
MGVNSLNYLVFPKIIAFETSFLRRIVWRVSIFSSLWLYSTISWST